MKASPLKALQELTTEEQTAEAWDVLSQLIDPTQAGDDWQQQTFEPTNTR